MMTSTKVNRICHNNINNNLSKQLANIYNFKLYIEIIYKLQKFYKTKLYVHDKKNYLQYANNLKMEKKNN